MECVGKGHTGARPADRRRLIASILAGIAAGLLCGLAQAQETKTLSWTPPTERVDGTALSADQLAAHRVLCEPGVDVSVPMPATSWAGVEPGIESCVVRAVDQDGLESVDSARVYPEWEPEPQPDPPGAPTNVRVVAELPPSTGPPGGGVVADLYINWQGAIASNQYTLAAPEVPVDEVIDAYDGSIQTLSSYGDIRVFELANNLWYARWRWPDIPAAARIDHTGGGVLFFVDPQSFATNSILFELVADDSVGLFSGGIVVSHTVEGDMQISSAWGSWAAEGSATIAWPTGPFWLWMRLDPSHATASERLKYKLWAWGGAVPEDWTGISIAGTAANSENFSPLTDLTFSKTQEEGTGLGIGPIAISTDPDEDLSAFVPSTGGGSTVEAGLETGSEAGAGFDARVVSRADISEATSAGSTHGAIGTIRAAITEGATAQQVAAGVASMAAQLAEATLAGAGVTARATVSEAITEPAGAGEAVSRQGEALAQVAASAEADAVLSAYLQAVAALAAGIEAGDSWAARLTAAATFSGAAEAGGEFAEDSVALIAAESQAGAQFAAAVHALAEQLEGATAGAAMAGIVSTLAAFSSASSAGAVFESAMRHADALQAGAEAGAAFSGITGELTGHLLSAVSAGMVVSSAHQARAAWTSTALAGASFVASGDVSALIGALAFVVAAEQRVFTVPAETRTFIVS